MTENGIEGCVRLRNLEFDPEARLARVEGKETPLDARSSTVLATLVAKVGQRVSKDELLRAAWPNQTVHENSLAKAISRLRQAIQGSGLEIAVAYGAGYILRELPDDRTAPAIDRTAEPKSVASRPATLIALCVGLALVAAAIILFQTYIADPAVRDGAPLTHDAPDATATILWVDDHPSNNSNEVAMFRKHRVAVHLAENTDDALKLLAINSYRLVISDLGRGEDRLAGLRMIQAMKSRGMTTPVMIYTVRPDDRFHQQAQRRIVAAGGATDLAVTPEEVRAKAMALIQRAK